MTAKLPVRWMATAMMGLGVGLAPLAAQEAPSAEAEPPPPEAPIVTPPDNGILFRSIPAAITFIDPQTIRASEIIDLKSVDRLASSLLTLSGPSEATGTALRVRGVGTVSPNPGVQPSVDVRIDGVYRGRAGTALGELGTLDRVEVHRGPEAGVAGRSATAGLVDFRTPAPDFSSVGRWNIIKGNNGAWRIGGDVTSPVKADKMAMRFDGWWETRNGVLTDLVSEEAVNERARYLLRGQLLWFPADDLSVRLIGDFARRRDQCCAAVTLPFSPAAAPVVATLRANGAILADDPARREASITRGRGFSSAVEDWGLSAELRWEKGPGTLTSITAYRGWRAREAQDSDGNNLDLVARDRRSAQTGTFSQELRYEGRQGPLDWLVGGYVAREALDHGDDLAFGADYADYADGIVRLSDPAFQGFDALATSLGLPGATLDGSGIVRDEWRQNGTRLSLFTHHILSLHGGLALTLGARYNRASTSLNASLMGDNALCGAVAAQASLAPLLPMACAIPGFSTELEDRRSDDGLTGTAILSWKPSAAVLLFAGYRSGWKPGGFTLDRLALDPARPDSAALGLAAESSEGLELGARYGRDGVAFGLTLFSTRFSNFQHAFFDGARVVAASLASCADPLVAGGCPAEGLRPSLGSRGIEAEASFELPRDLRFDLGFTFADTRFRDRLVNSDGAPLDPALAALSGERPPAAPTLVHTGRLYWTPRIARTPLRLLMNLDWRFSSDFAAADPAIDAGVPAAVVLNVRGGVTGPDGRWSVELWANNLTNALVIPVAERAPLPGAGDAAVLLGWPEMPRTFGLAMRTRF